MRTATALLCAASLAALFLGGCSTASTGPVVNVNPPYVGRTSPENVLRHVVTSYVWMNATEYLDCLSEDFEFYPDEADVQDPNLEIPPVWYKTDEQNMHENMFDEGSDVESISLTLTVTSIVYDYGVPEDGLDDTCVCRVDVDLRVNLQVGVTYLATAPSEFLMRVDTDQQGAGGERFWEIHMWYDLGSGGRGGDSASGERTSWGIVKSLYK
ncbi:MAG: hypothetical protein ABIK85_01765 [Candidatus Eisenbacteria bacterium]